MRSQWWVKGLMGGGVEVPPCQRFLWESRGFWLLFVVTAILLVHVARKGYPEREERIKG